MLECGKEVAEVNRHILINFSPLYTLQSKPTFSRPSIPRSEIDDITRDADANDRTDKKMVSKALDLQRVVDHHALYAVGAQPAGGGGAGPGGKRRNRRGGRFKDEQQQQQPQQPQQPQQQQQQPPEQQQQHRPCQRDGNRGGALPGGITGPEWRCWDAVVCR